METKMNHASPDRGGAEDIVSRTEELTLKILHDELTDEEASTVLDELEKLVRKDREAGRAYKRLIDITAALFEFPEGHLELAKIEVLKKILDNSGTETEEVREKILKSINELEKRRD